MGLNHVTAAELQKHLPCSILSFGYPDEIQRLDLTGSTLVSVDLFCHGPERIADLSLPQDLGEYDLVLDCGTSEHVVNPSQAILNAARAVKVGGRVLHHLPLTMVNHGYWNFCPSFLHDFYVTNGFEIERFDLTGGPDDYGGHQLLEWPSTNIHARCALPPESLILCVARRRNWQVIRLPRCEPRWG